jgi:hypothetical protein
VIEDCLLKLSGLVPLLRSSLSSGITHSCQDVGALHLFNRYQKYAFNQLSMISKQAIKPHIITGSGAQAGASGGRALGKCDKKQIISPFQGFLLHGMLGFIIMPAFQA